MKLLPRLRQAHREMLFAMLRRRATPLALTNRPALIVAPHPDDETLGCGGLIALKRGLGVSVTVVMLTQGDQGPGDPSHCRLAALRHAEARAALGVLNVPETAAHYWQYPDGGLSALSPAQQQQLVDRLAELMRQDCVEEVFVTHRADGHPDHEAAYRLTRAAVDSLATRSQLPDVPGPPPPAVYEYAIWLAWSRPVAPLRPSLFKRVRALNIAAALNCKRRAAAAYVSQMAAFPPGFAHRFEASHEVFFAADGAL